MEEVVAAAVVALSFCIGLVLPYATRRWHEVMTWWGLFTATFLTGYALASRTPESIALAAVGWAAFIVGYYAIRVVREALSLR